MSLGMTPIKMATSPGIDSINPLSTRPHQSVVWYNDSLLGFQKVPNYVPKEREKKSEKNEPSFILANCSYLIGTVPILTQEKGRKKSNFIMCSYICKNLPVVMYRKFRNVPIFKDIPPICPYFLGFRVGKYANLSQLNVAMAHRNYFRRNNPRILKLATYTKIEDHYSRCKLATF